MDEKICFKCKELKPFDDFYNFSRSYDGKTSTCKECWKDRYGKDRELNTRADHDEKVAKLMLTRMGYDLDSDLTIREQHLIRLKVRYGIDQEELLKSERVKKRQPK